MTYAKSSNHGANVEESDLGAPCSVTLATACHSTVCSHHYYVVCHKGLFTPHTTSSVTRGCSHHSSRRLSRGAVHTTHHVVCNTGLFTPHTTSSVTRDCSHHTPRRLSHETVHTTHHVVCHTGLFTPHTTSSVTRGCSHHTPCRLSHGAVHTTHHVVCHTGLFTLLSRRLKPTKSTATVANAKFLISIYRHLSIAPEDSGSIRVQHPPPSPLPPNPPTPYPPHHPTATQNPPPPNPPLPPPPPPPPTPPPPPVGANRTPARVA